MPLALLWYNYCKLGTYFIPFSSASINFELVDICWECLLKDKGSIYTNANVTGTEYCDLCEVGKGNFMIFVTMQSGIRKILFPGYEALSYYSYNTSLLRPLISYSFLHLLEKIREL